MDTGVGAALTEGLTSFVDSTVGLVTDNLGIALAVLGVTIGIPAGIKIFKRISGLR